MPWLQLRIQTTPNEAHAIEKAVLAAGASAVTLEDNEDQPIFEPELGETPLWNKTRVTGLFDAGIDTAKTLERVQAYYRKNTLETHWHVLEDKDWEREWEKSYHPIQCSDNMWICPSWISPPDPHAVNLMLDPGLAFGTGTHPTTFMCLQWLAKQSMIDKKVMDYGCGSGILGIAALLLGANNAQGIDIDPQALTATKNNATGNNLSEDAFPVALPQNMPSQKYDIVLANILAGPLVELAPILLNLLNPGGKICLSGILATQKNALLLAYEKNITFSSINEQDGWICMTGELTNSLID